MKKLVFSLVLLSIALLSWGRGGGCFPAGTPIMTDRGSVPVEKVQVGQTVEGVDWLEGNGPGLVFAGVEKVFVLKDRLLEVVTDKGTLTTTGEHPVLVLKENLFVQNGFRPAKDVQPGDRLAWVDSLGLIEPAKVFRLIPHKQVSTVYNLEVSGIHTFIADRFVVHNKGGFGGSRSSFGSSRGSFGSSSLRSSGSSSFSSSRASSGGFSYTRTSRFGSGAAFSSRPSASSFSRPSSGSYSAAGSFGTTRNTYRSMWTPHYYSSRSSILIYDTDYVFFPHYYAYSGSSMPDVGEYDDHQTMTFEFLGGRTIVVYAYQRVDNLQKTENSIILSFNGKDYETKTVSRDYGSAVCSTVVVVVRNNSVYSYLDDGPWKQAQSWRSFVLFMGGVFWFLVGVGMLVGLIYLGAYVLEAWTERQNHRKQEAQEQARKGQRSVKW